MFRKKMPGRGFHAGNADDSVLAKINVIEIEGENFPFGVAPFEIQGKRRLGGFPPECPPRVEQKIFGQLLRDGAAALHPAGGHEVVPRGPEDGADVQAGMLVKPPVLDRDDRILEISRNFLPGRRLSTEFQRTGEFADGFRLKGD
mgnify:CR=1 FL=1